MSTEPKLYIVTGHDGEMEEASDWEVSRHYNKIYVEHSAYQALEQKFAVAVEALSTTHKQACSCCDSNDEAKRHCEEALALINPTPKKAGSV